MAAPAKRCSNSNMLPQHLFANTSIALLLAVVASGFAHQEALAQCAPAGPYNNGADTVNCNPGTGDVIDTLGGNDRVTVRSGTVTSIDEGTGADRLTVNDGTLGSANQDSGNDRATVNGGAITGTLDQGTGRDTYVQSGGTVGTVDQGSSGDTATIRAGSILNTIQQGSGNDRLTINGGTITTVDQGSFNDRLILNDGTVGTVDTGTGRDNSTINAGTVTGLFQQGSGVDRFTMFDGQLGALDQGADFDRATIRGGHIIGQFVDGDRVVFSGGRIGSVNLSAGNNVFLMSGTAAIDTFLNAEQGRDRFDLTGGTIGTFINTGSNNDRILLDGTTVGGFIDFETGNDRITLSSGSVGGDVLMGDGSDRATITSTFDPVGLGGNLDGGDDVSRADGQTDTLTFSDWTGSLAGAKLLNWENITIDGGSVNFSDGMLTTGQDVRGNGRPRTGLRVTGDGQLDMGSTFTLTGNATLDADGSILAATPGGIGNYLFDGQFVNNGHLDFSGPSPAAGDRLAVSGDYYGGGSITFDSALDASEATDQLIIGGRVRAPGTIVTVNDVGTGLGAPTGSAPGDGIKVVDVSNSGATSEGDFTLNAPLETGGISGAYVYDIVLESDGNWYLQSVYVPDPRVVTPQPPPGPGPTPPPRPAVMPLFAPTVPVYEVYPQILLGLNGLPTLHQRVGDRYSAGKTANSAAGCDSDDAYGIREEECFDRPSSRQASWAMLTASHLHSEQARSKTSAEFESNEWKFEGGADLILGDLDGVGSLIGGITIHYGRAIADVSSPFGTGEIDAAVGGVGLTGTLISNGGGYLDAQGRFSWSSADLDVNPVGKVAHHNRGFSYTLGIEAGQKISLSPQFFVTPQAQIVFKSIDFDTFTDRFNGRVLLDDGDSLAGRLGLQIENKTRWTSADGSGSSQSWFAVGNLHYEFLDGSRISVAGVEFESGAQKFWGELGIGGTLSWADDTYSLSGEVKAQTSLDDFANSYGVAGKADFRVRY